MQWKLIAFIVAMLAVGLAYGCNDDGTDGDADADGDGDADIEPSGTATYTTCVGSYQGTCSEHCCASENPHFPIASEPVVTCQVTPADGDNYRLDFSVGTADGETGIEGVGIIFSSTATDTMPVSDCDQFIITEDGNDYPSAVCDTQDVRPDGGGGCEVAVYSEAQYVSGTFLCNEVELPGQPSYLSTIYSGGVGVGMFTIDNCDFQL